MPTQEPPDEKLADLQNGRPVSSRVANADHAWRICRRFVNDDRIRAARRVKVQGAFDGNAPKSQADMVRAGRGNDCNLNFRRHRGQIMNAWPVFFDLVCEVPTCINGDLEFGDATQDEEAMRGFAKYFHDLLFNHTRGFDDTSQLCDLQMLLHGPGVLAWEDEWDYRPKAILAGNIYFPNETNVSLDNCEMAMLDTFITAGQLWRKISEPTQPGWNVEACRAAIMDSALSNSDMRQWNWMRWEQAFKNGDYYVSQTQTRNIQLYTLFVEEMDGTISQKIIQAKDMGGNGKFLFESDSRYDSWDECLCLFPYDIGADGTYHSIRGLGTDIYPFCALLNSIDNSTADMVVSGIKPMWQPTTNAKMADFKMAKWGGGNFVPNGIQPLQLDIARGIQPALEVSRQFAQTMSGNTAAASNDDFAAPTVEETAKSAMIRAAERDKVTKGLRNRYMRSKGRQYAEMWRRAVNPKLRPHHPGAKEALKFQKRCYDLCDKLGLPHKALQAVTNIRSSHSIGNGSAAMRYETAGALIEPNYIDRLDEQGQNNALRTYTAVMTSHHDIDAYVPSLTTGRDASNDASFATLENDALVAGGKALVAPGQNHVLHLQTHIPAMEEAAQMCVQGQQDPRQCFAILESIGAHSGKHMEKLQSNPTRKREFDAFSQQLDALAQYQNQLEQNIAEQDAAAAQEPQPGAVDPELVKVQGNLQLKKEKDEGTLALKAQAQEFKQQLAAQQAQFERALKDAQTAAELNRTNQITSHEIRTDSVKTAHEMSMNQKKSEEKVAESAE